MFTIKQVRQLLQPINPRRVKVDGKGNNHVPQQEITAHLTRIFGFGNWTKQVLSLEPIFEMQRDNDLTKNRGWDVAYLCTIRLTVWETDDEGNRTGRTWVNEDGSTGDAQNSARWDAHDLAMKSAISTAMKRCAKDLGDQFGLSLYNKGSVDRIVVGLIEPPVGLSPEHDSQADEKDIQDQTPEPQGDGIDETPTGPREPDEEQQARLAQSVGAGKAES